MTQWLSAEHICELYAVKRHTLLAYSSRGNLATRVDMRGKRLFNAGQAANIFPSRSQDASSPHPMSLGTLGQAMLRKPASKVVVQDNLAEVGRINRTLRKPAPRAQPATELRKWEKIA